MKAMKGADDGVDDEDNTIITAGHAYDLAKKDELLAANKIGVTKDTLFCSHSDRQYLHLHLAKQRLLIH